MHTPGPWEIEPDGNDFVITSHEQYMPIPVATVHSNPNDDDVGDAASNARLIAAAPELLAALEYCLLRVHKHLATTEELDRARAAIAKARGA